MRQESYIWKNVEIVGGGFITGALFHPKQRDLIYARTDIGGAYRWNPKIRRWVPLQDWLEKKDWNLYGVESIGLDPTNPERLYIAAGTYTNDWAGNGAMLRSADQGQTFQRTDLPFKLGGNENGRGMGERLSVDPKNPRTVLFGSRHNGLWRSDDFGATWARVESFPVKDRTDGVGIAWVLHHASGVYAAARTDRGHLWHSKDGGKTWHALPTHPLNRFHCHHGAFDAAGILYLTFANGPGPNEVTDGAVAKYNPKTAVWTEITPEKPGNFGYAGLALDSKRPGVLTVSSLDRWAKGDTLWRTTNGGKTWKDYKPTARRTVDTVDWLKFGRPAVDLGHWIACVAIDPFRPGHMLYGTGATLWGSDNADAIDSSKPTHWTVRAQGLEETAILDLLSPPIGPPLISAMGDIGGFRHDDLDKVPLPGRALSPMFNTTNHLAIAGAQPERLVASGNAKVHGAFSKDGGQSWKLFASEPAGTRGAGDIALSADGEAILWAPQGATPGWSINDGAAWTACEGIPAGVRVAADTVQPRQFWAYDPRTGKVYHSDNGGATFTPAGETATGSNGAIYTPPRAPGNAWVCTDSGLWYRMANNESFQRVAGVDSAQYLGFGAPRPGSRYPTLFLNGKVNGVEGIWRSDDVATNWVRIDDAAHRFGTSNVITGDPRRWGRVYLGTNGRGILYADPAGSKG